MSSSVLDALGSPAAVVGFGVTTAVLLATTWYLKRLNEKQGRTPRDRVANRHPTANGAAKVVELDRAKYPGGHLAVYYGSQTGTAQMFAKQVASESESRGFCTRVVDLQDVVDNEDDAAFETMKIEYAGRGSSDDGAGQDGGGDVALDEEGAIIRAALAHPHYRDDAQEGGGGDGRKRSKALFFMATYGEGEPTDNAQQFVEMMKGKSGISNIYKISGEGGLSSAGSSASLEDPASDSHASVGLRDAGFLDDLDYAVFGLGNKQYEHYNNMSRFTDAALEKCGASRIAPLGLGDDDDDLEGDFEAWKDNVLWPALTAKYVKGKVDVLTVKRDEEGGRLPSCPYRVEYLKEGEALNSDGKLAIQTSSKHYLQAREATVATKRELRDPSDPGSTIHMEINISGQMDALRYQTADNLGILPKNDASIVETVAEALNFDLDQIFHLLPNTDGDNGGGKHALPFPTPCTVRECLERYCDLTGPPRRSDLKQLATYAKGELDRSALLRMSSKEGKAEYKQKIVEAHVGIADIVTRLCPSIACPLEHFVMVCPRVQPRYYTISSSTTVHPETIHITFAVLESEKRDGGKFIGLCSGYLAGLSDGASIRAFVRESTFRLPGQVERPVIMFGPGTGIAPMRAILQERSHGRRKGEGHGPSILYFGCKDRNMDYLYRNELEQFEEEGTLSELHLAFSREQPEKVYVQHLLAKRAEETWKLIHDDKASVFVCGAVKMGADVDHALRDIVSEYGGMSAEKSKAYLDRMAVAGRFVQELWS